MNDIFFSPNAKYTSQKYFQYQRIVLMFMVWSVASSSCLWRWFYSLNINLRSYNKKIQPYSVDSHRKQTKSFVLTVLRKTFEIRSENLMIELMSGNLTALLEKVTHLYLFNVVFLYLSFHHLLLNENSW